MNSVAPSVKIIPHTPCIPLSKTPEISRAVVSSSTQYHHPLLVERRSKLSHQDAIYTIPIPERGKLNAINN